MADEFVVFRVTKQDGGVDQQRVPTSETWLSVDNRQLVGVSDDIAQLTRVTQLRLFENAFAEIPPGVLFMTRLTELKLSGNRLVALPREIGRLKALTHLFLDRNKLAALPREIGQLVALKWLYLDNNALTSLPAELGELQSLQWLFLQRNKLAWLPVSMNRLVAVATGIILNGNALPLQFGDPEGLNNALFRFPEIFAASSHLLAVIRSEAASIAIGLQDLELPALVTLEIIDAAFPNSIPIHKKWDLVTAIKHFRERH